MTVLDFKAPTSAAAPPSYAELAARFRPIFAKIAEGAVRREQSRDLAFEAVAWLRDAGFGALRVPKSYGGFGATLPQLFKLITELGEADSNLPQIFRAHFGFVELRLNSNDENSRALWFGKIVKGDLIGAGMAERTEGTETTVKVEKKGDRWRLDGRKYYSTGTIYADWISVTAAIEDERANVVVSTTAEGVTRVDDWDGFGQRLTGSGTTIFENVEVPEENILRRHKLGEFPDYSHLGAFYQLVHLATLAGIARAVLRDGVDFVQKKTRTFGVPGKSSPRVDPLVQQVIGRLSSLVFATESVVDAAAAAVHEAHEALLAGAPNSDLDVTADIKTYQAQQIAIDLVLQATTLLFEVGGASATSENLRLDRHWRNARTLASHNPAVHRARLIGDHYLNGVNPREEWMERWKKAAAESSASIADESQTLAAAVAE